MASTGVASVEQNYGVGGRPWCLWWLPYPYGLVRRALASIARVRSHVVCGEPILHRVSTPHPSCEPIPHRISPLNTTDATSSCTRKNGQRPYTLPILSIRTGRALPARKRYLVQPYPLLQVAQRCLAHFLLCGRLAHSLHRTDSGGYLHAVCVCMCVYACVCICA